MRIWLLTTEIKPFTFICLFAQSVSRASARTRKTPCSRKVERVFTMSWPMHVVSETLAQRCKVSRSSTAATQRDYLQCRRSIRRLLLRTWLQLRFDFDSTAVWRVYNSYFFCFILGRAVDWAGLTASFRAHVNIVSLLTYLLTYQRSLRSQWRNPLDAFMLTYLFI